MRLCSTHTESLECGTAPSRLFPRIIASPMQCILCSPDKIKNAGIHAIHVGVAISLLVGEDLQLLFACQAAVGFESASFLRPVVIGVNSSHFVLLLALAKVMPKSNSVSTPKPLAAAAGTDTVYAIEAANPELADIIKSLKTTYAVLGGQFEDNTKTLDTSTFDGRRTLIQHELHRVSATKCPPSEHAPSTFPAFSAA